MAKMATSLTSAIQAATTHPRQDSSSKELLCHVDVMKWILKGTIPDLAEVDVDKIKPWIGEAKIGTMALDVNVPDKVVSIGTSSTTIEEENIYYDIRFPLNINKDGGITRILINVETQQKTSLKYPLLDRAIFYAGRMISEQKGTEFTNTNYGELKRIYSIWLLFGGRKYVKANHIRTMRYIFDEQEEGMINESNTSNIVFIGLGNENSNVKNETVTLLNILFGDKSVEEKLELISQTPYNIPRSIKLEEDITSMCGYGDYREERGREEGMQMGREEGMQEGMQRGKLEDICTLHKHFPNWSFEFIMDTLEIAHDKRAQYLKDFNSKISHSSKSASM